MGQIKRHVGEYTLYQVDYPRRSGDYDIVCQVKLFNSEICHCTWHPDGTINCKNRTKNHISHNECPCYGSSECLRAPL
jgi:hypothetical protein